MFEGVVIARKHGGLSETFTVRKVSSGVAWRGFSPLHCPSISQIEVKRLGKVRRAKLYYLRKRSGKSARSRREENFSFLLPGLLTLLKGRL